MAEIYARFCSFAVMVHPAFFILLMIEKPEVLIQPGFKQKLSGIQEQGRQKIMYPRSRMMWKTRRTTIKARISTGIATTYLDSAI